MTWAESPHRLLPLVAYRSHIVFILYCMARISRVAVVALYREPRRGVRHCLSTSRLPPTLCDRRCRSGSYLDSIVWHVAFQHFFMSKDSEDTTLLIPLSGELTDIKHPTHHLTSWLNSRICVESTYFLQKYSYEQNNQKLANVSQPKAQPS